MQTDGFQAYLTRLGRRVQNLRRERGYSQEKLAELVGMDRVSIGYIEQARRMPKISTLYYIADALDIKVEDLFDGLQ
ncbi:MULTISPECIES: helix-turn-helix domain-containing protein [Bifidobacterium]|uniref:Helix-turn-helix domain-containing protein n=2 Tax=Bifidobacterium TaxID=1678 RepID=A0A6N9Z3H7_9BIFI|nr:MULTISPECIES: helix-turn-helix transcriptional regulator [Bifidobacterium]KFI96871.1 putative Transcriptional regulator, XRE family [Bifidobacterium stellenboschense]NEG89122.1 helix-turn-helix domain-containing protein [Bifidobacterium aerophilum]